VEQISTCSPGRTPPQSRGVPEGGCDPVGSLRWSRLLAGPVTPWEGPPLEQSIPEGLHAVGRAHAGVLREELSPMGGTSHWSRGRV